MEGKQTASGGVYSVRTRSRHEGQFETRRLEQLLPLQGNLDSGKRARAYKSEKRAKLIAEGYRIHGSSGDQWSDLMGEPMANRSFKVPNPMYHIP
ncbi:hypothetical protein KSP40_PGU012163 [Platanthera guangdongensis]|uniref:Uncharacterized protein n=1 Tax=Platanthera guangdongensis TaxID=2320717 RepID=A0ABR2N327_9ASPA